jgi:cyanophycinase
MGPKGKMLIIGGAEDKGDFEKPEISRAGIEHFEILKELISNGRSKAPVEIITTASEVPDEVKGMYQHSFNKIGYKNVGYMHFANKMETRQEKYYERLQKAGAVLFSGGDQFRLSSIIGGTTIADIIKDRYCNDKDFIIAGTSAGAMVMSEVMISGGGISEALFGRDIKTTSGLGLVKECIIDTHFIKRGRFARLAHAVIINPGQLGIGLGEDTALIIKNGRDAECRGSGMVVIIDGKDIDQTNVTEANEDDPIFVENLRVHLLVRGCRFSIAERKLANPAIKKMKAHPV